MRGVRRSSADESPAFHSRNRRVTSVPESIGPLALFCHSLRICILPFDVDRSIIGPPPPIAPSMLVLVMRPPFISMSKSDSTWEFDVCAFNCAAVVPGKFNVMEELELG